MCLLGLWAFDDATQHESLGRCARDPVGYTRVGRTARRPLVAFDGMTGVVAVLRALGAHRRSAPRSGGSGTCSASVTDRIPRLGLSTSSSTTGRPGYFADGRWFTNPFLCTTRTMSAPTALHPPLYTVVPRRSRPWLGFDTPTAAPHRRPRSSAPPPSRSSACSAGGIAGDRAGSDRRAPRRRYPPLWSNDSVIGLETLYCFLVVLALLAVYRFWARTERSGAARPGRACRSGARRRSPAPRA